MENKQDDTTKAAMVLPPPPPPPPPPPLSETTKTHSLYSYSCTYQADTNCYTYQLGQVPPPPPPRQQRMNSNSVLSQKHTMIRPSPPPQIVQLQETETSCYRMPINNNNGSDVHCANKKVQPTNVASDDEKEEDKAICRICLQEDETTMTASGRSSCTERLISPCHCRGSMKYVHLSCLQSWRSATVRKDSSKKCEQCQYEYQFQHSLALHWFLKYDMGPYLLVSTTTVLMTHLLGLLVYEYGLTSRQARYAFGELWIRPLLGDAFWMGTYYGRILSTGIATTLFLLFCLYEAEMIWETLAEYRDTRTINRIAIKKFMHLGLWIYFELAAPTPTSPSCAESSSGWKFTQRDIRYAILIITAFMYYFERCTEIVRHLRNAAKKLGETILEPPPLMRPLPEHPKQQ